MHDKTATQTSFEPREATSPRPARLGVVVVFSEAEGVRGAVPVEALVRVGREPGCELLLADTRVSRQHAELTPAEGGVRVRDLGSHNGTLLDGERIGERGAFAPVGSTLRLGKTLVRVVAAVDAFAHYPDGWEEPLVGGPALDLVRTRVAAVGRTPSPVLVQGETGTGKERVAEAIHLASKRPGRLVAINCAAIPSELVEAELFGHAKGAFSGSQKARPGLFRTADAGTLLLDEFGELPLATQAKLLRVVEDGQVRPVGEDVPQLVDVRVVAATNRDLEAMVEAGAFRADLFHRLSAFRVRIPPLRERLEDVPVLASYFLKDDPLPFTASAMGRMLAYGWPGNVRELRNAVLAAATTARARGAEAIDVEDVSAYTARSSVGPTREPTAAPPPSYVPSRSDDNYARRSASDEQQLRERILSALERADGNVAQAARDLDMRRARLYEAFGRLDIDPTQYRRR